MRDQRILEKPSLSSLQKVSLKAPAASIVWLGARGIKRLHSSAYPSRTARTERMPSRDSFSCSSMKLGFFFFFPSRPRRLLATFSHINMAPSALNQRSPSKSLLLSRLAEKDLSEHGFS